MDGSLARAERRCAEGAHMYMQLVDLVPKLPEPIWWLGQWPTGFAALLCCTVMASIMLCARNSRETQGAMSRSGDADYAEFIGE